MKNADRLIAGGKVNNDFLHSLEEASEKLADTLIETVEIAAHDEKNFMPVQLRAIANIIHIGQKRMLNFSLF